MERNALGNSQKLTYQDVTCLVGAASSRDGDGDNPDCRLGEIILCELPKSSKRKNPCCIQKTAFECNMDWGFTALFHQEFCISQAMMVCLQSTQVVTEPTPAGTGEIF